jgi:hypothetical protein
MIGRKEVRCRNADYMRNVRAGSVLKEMRGIGGKLCGGEERTSIATAPPPPTILQAFSASAFHRSSPSHAHGRGLEKLSVTHSIRFKQTDKTFSNNL